MKLFNDNEVFQKERPTNITKEQAQALYEKIADEIIKFGHSKAEEREFIIEDLSGISFNENGYEIAKKLEDNCSATYDFDEEFVSYLGGIYRDLDSVHNKNIQDWVEANGIKPKISKGQELMVEIDLNRHKKKGAIVYVNGWDEKRAVYYIDEDPKKNGGTIIAYEVVEKRCKLLPEVNQVTDLSLLDEN